MVIRFFFSKIKYNFKSLDIVLALSLLISMGFGVVLVGNFADTALQQFNSIFSLDLTIKSNSSFVSNFLSSLGSSTIFLVTIILSSLSLVGIIGIFATIILKGMGLGLMFGNLYISYSFKNALARTLLLLPSEFVVLISLIFLATESLKFTITIFKKNCLNLDKKEISIFDYIKKIAISGIVLIIAALFDSCIVTGLARFFHF